MDWPASKVFAGGVIHGQDFSSGIKTENPGRHVVQNGFQILGLYLQVNAIFLEFSDQFIQGLIESSEILLYVRHRIVKRWIALMHVGKEVPKDPVRTVHKVNQA